jgi:hypothetical protein
MTVPESEEQRRNRELIELLNELRVALPGVQLLSTVFLIAPSSYNRLRWREHDKERMLVVSNVATIIGLTLLAVAITCTVFVITDFIFHRAWAAGFTAIVAVAFVVLRYGLPFTRGYVDRKR